MKYTDLHYGQIPTTCGVIETELLKSGSAAIRSLLRCFSYGIASNKYINQLIVTAAYFERISCLVYKNSDGKYKKLPKERYKKEKFKGYAETVQEVFERAKNYGASETDAERIYKKIWQIADLICPMLACIEEQAFVTEYAYAIDYVIKQKTDLPKPNMSLLFPTNYRDYQYWEGPLIEKIHAYS